MIAVFKTQLLKIIIENIVTNALDTSSLHKFVSHNFVISSLDSSSERHSERHTFITSLFKRTDTVNKCYIVYNVVMRQITYKKQRISLVILF